YDLLRQPAVERVTIADLEPERIPGSLEPHAGKRLALLKLAVQDGAARRAAMVGHQAVQNAAPYNFNPERSRAAVHAAVHRPELGHVTFPPPVGQLEAFHTGGGISTLPWTYEGKVRTMEYKTLRYPGHIGIMRPIRELGLLDLTPVKVKGQDIVPREAFIATV